MAALSTTEVVVLELLTPAVDTLETTTTRGELEGDTITGISA